MPAMSTFELIKYLFCVHCNADALTIEGDHVRCLSCGYQYPNEEGIPDFRITSDIASVDSSDLFGESLNREVNPLSHSLQERRFSRMECLLHSAIPDLKNRVFFFIGTGTGNDIRYLHQAIPFHKAIGFDISPAYLVEHRKYAERHYSDVSLGLILASNSHIPVKKMDGTLGLAISTLHHSGDQNEQIVKLLTVNFGFLLISDGRSTPVIRLLEKLGLATRPEGHAGTMKPSTFNLVRLKAELQQKRFAYRYQTYFFPPSYLLPRFHIASWKERLVLRGVDFLTLIGKLLGIDKQIDIVIYPQV